MLPLNLVRICWMHILFNLLFYMITFTAYTFGNPTRLDYGTGHELHFVVWTYCLRAINVLKQTDEQAIVLHIFPR